MKKLLTLLTVSTLLASSAVKAQDATKDLKYRRSSLSMILIESDDFPNKAAVMKSWGNYPFPDKYNQHKTALKSFNPNSIKISDQEMIKAGFLKDTLKTLVQITKAKAGLKTLKYLNADNSMAVVMPTEKEEYQMKLDKYIKDNKLANKMVGTWFNKSNGKFDMSVIQERGFYNASELEASIAQGQTRGLASLADAGEELIRNTFATFTKIEFIENEPAARLVRDVAKTQAAAQLAGKPAILVEKAYKGIDEVYDRTKEGYTLFSKTWLYRLNWNDSISAVFYNELWSNPDAFDKSDLFSLEFVGVQYNQSLVTFSLTEKRTQEQLIDMGLVRNIDNAFAELQRENEVFKSKTPVMTADPVTAQIGMKEGLKGGEKFDVLEMTMNPKTGLTEYKKIGSATADKKVIWDNRYTVGEGTAPVLDEKGNPITSTKFSGSSKIQPGMLLKQAK